MLSSFSMLLLKPNLGTQRDYQGFCSQVKVPLLIKVEKAAALSFQDALPLCCNQEEKSDLDSKVNKSVK